MPRCLPWIALRPLASRPGRLLHAQKKLKGRLSRQTTIFSHLLTCETFNSHVAYVQSLQKGHQTTKIFESLSFQFVKR